MVNAPRFSCTFLGPLSAPHRPEFALSNRIADWIVGRLRVYPVSDDLYCRASRPHGNASRAAGVVLLVTIIEDSGLVAWLALSRASMLYVGIPIAALVLLVVLLVEHSIMQRAENPDFTGKVFLRIAGFTVLEVINWRVWLALLSNTSSLLSMSSLVASAYFFVGFYIEHQITENVISGQPYLRFRNANRVITLGVILETLSEGVGARLWVLYGAVGIIFLVVGSVVEHSIQYAVGRQQVTNPVIGRESA